LIKGIRNTFQHPWFINILGFNPLSNKTKHIPIQQTQEIKLTHKIEICGKNYSSNVHYAQEHRSLRRHRQAGIPAFDLDKLLRVLSFSPSNVKAV
jgi:hypothetical protein